MTLALPGCGDRTASPAAAQASPAPAPVRTVACGVAAEAFEAPGAVVADARVSLASRFCALVRAIPKREGSAVAKGEVLVELDGRDIEAAVTAAEGKVRAARAAARDADTDCERNAPLAREGLISDNTWRKINLKREAARSDLAQAEALLAAAKAQRDYLTLRSPVDGRVARVMREAGDLALPGLPILVVDTESSPKFEFDVPEGLRERIRAGMSATVTTGGPGATAREVSAEVERVSTSADRLSRSYSARARLEAAPGEAVDALRPGMYGRIRIPLEPRAGDPVRPTVPRTALTTRGGLEGVFVVRDGRALFHWLRLGGLENGSVEVLSGLTGVESVVDAPSPLLFDGAAVSAAASEGKAGREAK